MVEHSAVNRRVAGSSPARGAKSQKPFQYNLLSKMYYTYIIFSPNHSEIYIGQTSKLKERISEHNEGKSSSTKRYIPWELVHYEQFKTRAEAMGREKELKSHKGRDFIRMQLLNGRVRQLPD